MNKFLSVLALTTALAGPASGATVEVAPFGQDESGTVYALSIVGEIQAYDDFKVQHALDDQLAAYPGNSLFVEMISPGGDMQTSLEIADIVHDSGIGVLVRGDCTSGCGIIALSARRGYLFVVEGGKIGLHQCWVNSYEPSPECTNGVVRALRGYGVPDRVLARMARTVPHDMTYLTDAELAAIGARVKRWAAP